MPEVVSFINMKGGVGKTTLAANVGYALAEIHDKKVLLIDIDPQFNASTYLMKAKDYVSHRDNSKKRTIVDIFTPNDSDGISTVSGNILKSKKGKPTLASYVHKVFDGNGVLDLIPSDLRLMIIQDSERGTENRLRTFIQQKAQDYDYVLIDCPPTISIFTQAAILGSNRYLVPLKPDALSTIGLPLLERWLTNFTENHGIKIESLGIVFSLVRENTNQMTKIMDQLRIKRPKEVFESHLSQSIKISESVEANQPIYEFCRGTKWATEILDIAEEFLDRTTGVAK